MKLDSKKYLSDIEYSINSVHVPDGLDILKLMFQDCFNKLF